MVDKKSLVPVEKIEKRILLIRDQRVMLDSDLAELYGVQTKALNQAVKRNQDRFPEDFMFQLTRDEANSLRSQTVTSKGGRGGRRYAPYVFTEHGAIMLASVLNTERAIEVSVYVVRAFVRLREMLVTHKQMAGKLQELEDRLDTHDEVIRSLVTAIKMLMDPNKAKKKRSIGFRPEDEK